MKRNSPIINLNNPTARQYVPTIRAEEYQQGTEAAKAGANAGHNPYLPGSLSGELWLIGYRDGLPADATA